GRAVQLEREQIVADLNTVAFADRDAAGNLVAVDLDAVVRAEVFDEDRAVLLGEAGVATRDVPLGQPDGIAFLPADGDLVANEGDDCGLPLVVLDDELEHAPASAQTREHRLRIVSSRGF